jgi:transcriptional accessory protein Tex/SPT6
MQLADIDCDAVYDGVVTNVGRYGVFVDFGAVKDGLLKVPVKIGKGFKRGMEVQSLAVVTCEPEEGRVVLAPQEGTILPEPPAPSGGKGSRSGSRGARIGSQGRGKSGVAALKDGGEGTKAKSRKPKEWGHPDGTPLEEVHEGLSLDGVVTNVSPAGVFVDIGATRDARLNVQAKIGRRFRIGDTIPDCKVESVNAETGRVTVAVADAEEVVKDLPPKERTKTPAAAPKAKASAKARAKSQSPTRGLETSPGAKAKPRAKKGGAKSIERLRVGQAVDGFVSNKNQYGIFVDIGIGKDAKLQVPKRMTSQFQRKDEIYGMVVESVDLEKMQISVSLEDPELDDGRQAPARGLATAPKAAAKAKGKAKAKAKQQAESGDHPNALPLSRFQAGRTADGVVTNIGGQGVFVDVGATRDGILKLPRAIANEFLPGDEVHGMLIEAIDSKNERVMLSLEDPELKEPGGKGGSAARRKSPEAKSGGKGGGRGEAKAKAKPKAKPAAKAKQAESWGHDGGMPLEELEVGTEVSGVVTNRGSFGVFLDFGAVKDGKLRLKKDEWKKFRKGDEVESMVIENVDIDAEQVVLALTFELPDGPEELIEEEPRGPPPKPKAKSRQTVATRPGSVPARLPSRGLANRPAKAKAKAGRSRSTV